MSQIEISCIGQSAVFTNTPDVFSGSVESNTVKFTFDSSWNNYASKTAVFYNQPKNTYLQILNSNNVATIPSEVLAEKGKLSIGVIGTKANGEVQTSKILTYVVGKGAVTNDLEVTAPTPDIWLQILSLKDNVSASIPSIGTNGHWYLGGVDTNVPANANTAVVETVEDDLTDAFDLRYPQMIVGAYTGDGTATRKISLNFTPKVVLVLRNGYSLMGTIVASQPSEGPCGGLAVTSNPVKRDGTLVIQIVNGGFDVYNNSTSILTNYAGWSYTYIALK